MPADRRDRRAVFERRLSIALGLSVRAGMTWEKAAPPGARWLWRRGLRLPPLHLLSFGKAAVLAGTVWGLPMSVFFIVQGMVSSGRVDLPLAIGAGLLGGAVFGTSMAIVMRWATRGRALPHWRDIDVDVAGPPVDPGVCIRCGYDLTGGHGMRCVECNWTPGNRGGPGRAPPDEGPPLSVKRDRRTSTR